MKMKHCIFVRNYCCEKITTYLYKFIKESFQFKIKILKSPFSKKHLKLVISDGHSYFSPSFPFLYGDSVGGYILFPNIHFETLFSTQPINLVVAEISRNKSVVETPITSNHLSDIIAC